MKIKDRLLLSTFAGFLAAIGAVISLYCINLYLPEPTVNMPQITLEIFLNINNYSLLQKILGLVWSTVVGGTYALLYIITLDITGWKNLWLKALIVVNGIWLLGAGFFIRLLNIAPQIRNETWSIAAFYIAHLLFATYLYLLVNTIGEQ